MAFRHSASFSGWVDVLTLPTAGDGDALGEEALAGTHDRGLDQAEGGRAGEQIPGQRGDQVGDGAGAIAGRLEGDVAEEFVQDQSFGFGEVVIRRE